MSWASSTNATGYIVYRQDSGSGDISWLPTNGTKYTTSSDVTVSSGLSSAKIIYFGAATSTVDKIDLEDNKVYQYKVFAFNDAYEYVPSEQRLSKAYPYETVAAAGGSACATKLGRLRCWGKNPGVGASASALGNGSDEYQYNIGDVPIGKEVLAVSLAKNDDLSNSHKCVLTSEGAVRCWGYNTLVN